jgi:hypothetical protein
MGEFWQEGYCCECEVDLKGRTQTQQTNQHENGESPKQRKPALVH